MKNIAAVWVTILVVAFGLASNQEDNYRQKAQRLDLKIMTLEMTGKPKVIPRMGKLRNESRAMAEVWENRALVLSLATGIAAVSMAASGYMALILLLLSAWIFAIRVVIDLI